MKIRGSSFEDRIIVFGRYPVPGKTKTRLIPHLGPAGAADLQRRLTVKTVSEALTFSRRRGIGVDLCFEGGTPRQMRRWLGPKGSLSRQAGEDLGARMEAAFETAFHEGAGRVVLVGTDIPGLRAEHLGRAFDALSEYDLVIGPSRDGGYWLMGLNRPASLFGGIGWGGGGALRQTLDLAATNGLRSTKLDELRDVDTYEDVVELLPGWRERRPYVSVIVPALDEGPNVERAIESAGSSDSEIIVVDGGSGDDTVPRAREAGARVVNGPRGRALQQNMGALESRGRVLLFLHADSILPRGYVGDIFELLMDPGMVAGAFRFRTDLDRPFMRFIEMGANLRSRYLGLPYGDQGLFFRKEVFERAGGFPRAAIAEDLIMMRRIRKEGRIGLLSSHVVTSARRWKRRGILLTTLINWLVVAGLCMDISPEVLSRLYRLPADGHKKNRKRWIS